MPKPLGPELQTLIEDRAPNDDVFRGLYGGLYRHRNWGRRVFRSALAAAGCDASRKNDDLRGTFASLAIQAGANINAMQRALGHESASLTLETYGHLDPDDLMGLGDQIEYAAY